MKSDNIEDWKVRCQVLATKNSRYKKQLRQMQKAYERVKYNLDSMTQHALRIQQESDRLKAGISK